jgi:hypothetical protein
MRLLNVNEIKEVNGGFDDKIEEITGGLAGAVVGYVGRRKFQFPYTNNI